MKLLDLRVAVMMVGCAAILLLASCDAGSTKQYPGALYFGQGAYLKRFSLVDGSVSIAAHLGDTNIRQVTDLGNGNLLVAETASVNRKRVPRISWVDPKTGETADLYAGVWTEQLADPGVVVYDDGSDLYAVPQQAGSDNKIIFSHPQRPLSRLLEASSGILLIEANHLQGTAFHAWDARSGSIRELKGLAASCRLEGAVWIGSLQRLACKQCKGPPAGAEYVLADLEGRVDGRLELIKDKNFVALAYVEKLDALVLQETRPGWLGMRDSHSVWIHELATGQSYVVASKLNLNGSVVYAEY